MIALRAACNGCKKKRTRQALCLVQAERAGLKRCFGSHLQLLLYVVKKFKKFIWSKSQFELLKAHRQGSILPAALHLLHMVAVSLMVPHM